MLEWHGLGTFADPGLWLGDGAFGIADAQSSPIMRTARLNPMNRGDIAWAIVGLFTIAFASAVILALARLVDPRFSPVASRIPNDGQYGPIL